MRKVKESCQRIIYSIICLQGVTQLVKNVGKVVRSQQDVCAVPPNVSCDKRIERVVYYRPDESPPVYVAVTDVGGSVYSATAPSLSGASCTRSQRSIESKSMESFFGARSGFHTQNSLTGVRGGFFFFFF